MEMGGTSFGTRAGRLWLTMAMATSIGGLFSMAGSTRGSEPSQAGETLTLWTGGAPGAKGSDPDKDVPTLTVWRPRPEVATGSAVVVCPGGGYAMLAMDHEGQQVAQWLNSLGI